MDKNKLSKVAQWAIAYAENIADGLGEFPTVKGARLALLNRSETEVYSKDFEAWLALHGTVATRKLADAMLTKYEELKD